LLHQTIIFAHHSTSDKSEEPPKSLRNLHQKLAPDLESKVIGPPNSRHKSIRHPSTHDPPEQTPKPIQTRPTNIPMPNSKTGKRWNNIVNRSSSNKNKPTQATNSTTISTATNFFSAPPSGPLYRFSSRRRKISNHPETGSTTTARLNIGWERKYSIVIGQSNSYDFFF